VEKNQGKLRMAIGLAKGGNVELSAAGGKTFIFPVEMALQAVLASKVSEDGKSLDFNRNQVLVIKNSDEMERLRRGQAL